MPKFTPSDTPKRPVIKRHNGKVLLLIDYKESGDRVAPIEGFDITEAYEQRRGIDAMSGYPLRDEYLRSKSVGEVAYLAQASREGWNVPWDELDEEQRESWQRLGSAVKSHLMGDEVPFLY